MTIKKLRGIIVVSLEIEVLVDMVEISIGLK